MLYFYCSSLSLIKAFKNSFESVSCLEIISENASLHRSSYPAENKTKQNKTRLLKQTNKNCSTKNGKNAMP